ncbi:sensor histidine kinase [Spirochaetia bacterium]|nr:sensor histidine kinase [Spirochaetia bacterium]GHV88176.1 sensor histidine kinase [Spirochaetia bacterium]
MKKRIFVSMILLTVISLVLVAAALCFVFYNQFSGIVRSELRERADLFRNADTQTAMQELSLFKPNDMRITLIHPDGIVAFDNAVGTEGLANHKDREEVVEAVETGWGESRRLSDTLGLETYYYAVRLADGSLLRIAKTTSSIWGMFRGVLPAVICIIFIILIIGYLLAGNLTKRIVAPINNLDLNTESTPPYDELVPFIRTIEQQRERIAEQFSDLQSRTDTIGAIMDSMSEGIILINRQGLILSVNKSAAALFETDTAMDGKNILELIRDLELLEHVRAALSGKRSEFSIRRSGKSYRVFFSPVTDRGALILFLDITEKMMAEQMRREFSANVSHELKTPLTSIYGHAEMLYSGIVKESDKHGFFGKIKDEAARLITLIEDIILISELDENTGGETFEEVSLAAIATDAAEALSLKASEHKVTVSISGNASMSAVRSMIYEMFYNLIDNAIKYNKSGGQVKVDVSQIKDTIEIAVADTGIGIPDDAQSRVFERFYRVDKSRSKKTGGTGLGLAIVKHIVLLHKGKLALKSSEGQGTVVTIIF